MHLRPRVQTIIDPEKCDFQKNPFLVEATSYFS